MMLLCIPIDIHFCGLWQALKSISFPQGPRQRNEFIQHPSLWLWLRVVIQPLQACRALHIYPGLSIQIDVQMFARQSRILFWLVCSHGTVHSFRAKSRARSDDAGPAAGSFYGPTRETQHGDAQCRSCMASRPQTSAPQIMFEQD